jgi:4-aminobutyrate aminotransferase/(S)-3-amino-2-methylpropionate transaminase
MLAIELVSDPETKEPAPDVALAVIEEAFRNGLLLIKSGTDGNCIRVLVPLTISDGELDEALGVWEDALATVLDR